MQDDFAVVGNSIVGLATAQLLLELRPRSSLLMIEKESEVAAHQTRHKSGVMPAGIYSQLGSLARLYCAGFDAIRAFYTEPGIPFEQCGKPIVATNTLEQQRCHQLHQRASANGLSLKRLNAGSGGFWKLVYANRKSAEQDLYGPLRRRAYRGACRQYCPELMLIDLLPYHAGIRARVITAQGALIQAFQYRKAGRPLHKCKAPSPVASSALAIVQMIALRCISNRLAGD